MSGLYREVSAARHVGSRGDRSDRFTHGLQEIFSK
jgi:hypothetical protein